MKAIPIDAAHPLPVSVLSEADREPVLLTVDGSPRYLLQCVPQLDMRFHTESAEEENAAWRALARERLLAAYAEEDSIYDEL